MTKSALQIARAAYQPKLPKGLTGTVKAVAGAATQSVADQEEIKKLFPNTYGMPLIKFETTDEVVNFPAMNVGVILSGGQAPGGHNVISGIFDGIKKLLVEKYGLEGTEKEALSYALYPKVFEDYLKSLDKEGNFRLMGSDIFFHGLSEGETCEVKIAEGKELVVRLSDVRDADDEGFRNLVFEVNGNRSAVKIKDQAASNIGANSSQIVYANAEDPNEIGANIPGNIIKVLIAEGDEVEEKQPIAVIEAMKMETNILAPAKGVVDKIYIKEGQQVKAGELIAKLK